LVAHVLGHCSRAAIRNGAARGNQGGISATQDIKHCHQVISDQVIRDQDVRDQDVRDQDAGHQVIGNQVLSDQDGDQIGYPGNCPPSTRGAAGRIAGCQR
jgi:hypothetical protein